MKGIFVPQEFLEDVELSLPECMVLAIYRYYTLEGSQHCCTLTNEDVCRSVRLNLRTLQRIKKHLKELGYIKTNGGIRVIFIEKRGDSDVAGGDKIDRGGDAGVAPGVTNLSQKGDAGVAHKKEKKKKRIEKRKEKSDMTNFDMLIDRLPDYYLTEERMDYLKKNYMDRINGSDMSGGAFDCWLINIKNELNRVFPIDYKVEKVDKKEDNDTVDLFW